MNHDFPRILALLRKEQGLSQKKVAADLGISQALLSHYEKGLRECGLEFVVRVANYYHVSCDYLLGRTAQRTGAVISVEELPDEKNKTDVSKKQNGPLEYDRRVLMNATNIVFALLKKINSKRLTEEFNTYLSCALYKTFRVLYSSHPKNPQGLFALDRRLFGAAVESTMTMAEAKGRYMLSGENIDGSVGVKKDALPLLTPESLSNEFPEFAPSLFDLIKSTEKTIQMGR